MNALARTMKRIKNDIIGCNDGNYVKLNVNDDDLFIVDFVMIGSTNSLWDGVKLTGKIEFPKDYPMSPPSIYFTCNI